MASQDVDSIVRSIARGMRGKPSKDFKYLHQMAKKYKDHPMYMEILRACYRLMRKSLPDDMRERFDDEDAQKGVSHTSVGVPSALAEAHEKQRCSDTSAAEEILSTAIQYWEKIHEEGAFQDDDAMEYRDFPNLMEEALYFARYAPKKEIQTLPEPISSLYLEYGRLLCRLDRLEEAKAALETAKAWNPVSTEILLEMGELSKRREDMDSYLQLTYDALSFSYNYTQLSKCYRNIGDYFKEWNASDEALIAYAISLKDCPQEEDLERSLIWGRVLDLRFYTDRTIDSVTNAEVQSFRNTYRLPHGISESVLQVASSFGEELNKLGNKDAAIYFYKVAYGIEKKDEFREALVSLGVKVDG